MGVHLLEGLWVAIDDLAQREVRSLDHLVKLVYGSHLEITSIADVLSLNTLRASYAIQPSAWRNCLEIRDRSRMGVRERPRRVEGVPIRVHLVATEARSRCLRLFSKQFRKRNSPKFAITEF